MKKNLAIVVLGIFLWSGCSQQPAPGATSTPTTGSTPAAQATTTADPSATPTPAPADSEDGKAEADKLLANLQDGKIPYKELSVKENGPAFLYLLETDQDPIVQRGALKGLPDTYTGIERYATKKNLAGDRYSAVILKYLDSDNKEHLHYALKATGPSLGGPEPNQAVLDKVVEIAGSHDEIGARYEAVDALYRVDKRAENEAVMGAFLKGLSDEPAVASLTLFRLNSSSPTPVKQKEIQAQLEELSKGDDPGTRGRALLVMERYTDRTEKEALIEKFKPFLKDLHPFVRSSAVNALANSRNTKAVAEIMTVIDDKEKNTYDIKFVGLVGNDSVHHDGSAWSRVDDTVLSGLERLTGALGDTRFKKGKIDYKAVDQDLAAEVKRAKEWFESNKGSL